MADFGLSKCVSSTAMVETSKWGTLSFMAPEHFSGQIGMAADVFSFGVLLWQVRGGGHVAGEGRGPRGR